MEINDDMTVSDIGRYYLDLKGLKVPDSDIGIAIRRYVITYANIIAMDKGVSYAVDKEVGNVKEESEEIEGEENVL